MVADWAREVGRKRCRLAAGLAAVLLLVSACGSTGGSKGSAATTAPPTNSTAGTASTASPIVVGNIGSYSGPASGDYVGTAQVLQAWAQSVNASGGINGHPIKLVVEDDGGVAAQSLALVKELVEQNHVVAIIGEGSAADTSFASYVQAQRIPVITGLPGSATFTNTNPSLFLIGSSIPSLGSGGGLAAKAAGRSRYGLMYCAESPGCAAVKTLYQPLVEAQGVKFAFAGEAAAASPSYTSVCLSAQQAGVDALDLTVVQGVIPRLAASCESQGYHPLFILPGSGDMTPLMGVPALNGSDVLFTAFPGFVHDPATQPYQAAVAKYLPGESLFKLGGAGTAAWLSAQLFEAAVKNLPGGFTAKDVFTGIYSLHNETLGGLAPGPLNFTPGVGLAGVDCVYIFKVENQTITAPNGIHASCPTAG